MREKVRFFTGRKPLPPAENGIRKIFADLNRICEIEDHELEWYDRAYFASQFERLPDLDFLRALFFVKQEYYSGVDMPVAKIELIARQPGRASRNSRLHRSAHFRSEGRRAS